MGEPRDGLVAAHAAGFVAEEGVDGLVEPRRMNLGDLYTESATTLQGSLSAVSKPVFANTIY